MKIVQAAQVAVLCMAGSVTGQIYRGTVHGGGARVYGAGVGTPVVYGGAAAVPVRAAAVPYATPYGGGMMNVGAAASATGTGGSRAHGGGSGVNSESNNGDTDGGAEAATSPYELYREQKFALGQAHNELYHIREYNRPTRYWMFEEAGFYPGSQLGDLWSMSTLADSYYYNIDALDDAIDHFYEVGNTNYDDLYALELRRDAQYHIVDAWDTYNIGNLGGQYSVFQDLADVHFLQRRNLDRYRSQLAVDQARDAYYSGEIEYEDYREAHRREWVDSKEALGVQFRMLDWLAPGANLGSYRNYPFVQATRSDWDRASRLAHDAEEAYYMNPSEDTYREWELADLEVDSEKYEHWARLGSLMGNDLFSLFGWWKQGEVDEHVDEIVHDHLHGHWNEQYHGGDFGSYGHYYHYDY